MELLGQSINAFVILKTITKVPCTGVKSVDSPTNSKPMRVPVSPEPECEVCSPIFELLSNL